MRSKRTWLVAILVGLIAVIGFIMLKGGGSGETDQVAQQPQINLGSVVVVKQDVPPRTVLTSEMIEVQEMPAEYIHPMAATKIENALDMISLVPINAGEQLLQTKIADPNTNYLSYKLKEGHVAYTVPVSDLTGAAGMIRVGDEVHVLGNFTKDVAGKDLSQFVLYDIKVIAIGQDMGMNGMAEADAFSSMTVEVTPEQASKLAWSANQGALSFILKSVLDKEDAEVLAAIEAKTFFDGAEDFEDKEYLDLLQKVVEIREAEGKLGDLGKGDVQQIRNDLNYERFYYDELSGTPSSEDGKSTTDNEDVEDSATK